MGNLNKHRTVFVNIFLKFIVSLTSFYIRFGKSAFLKMWFAQGSIGLNRILNNCMI